MNPYRNMTLREAKEALKEIFAKKREAKAHGDHTAISKMTQQQHMVNQRITNLMQNYVPTKEQVDKRNRKLEDRKERMSEFGFAISSHALHRYRLRFEPDTTMDGLYKKLQNTDLINYLKIKSTGECPIRGNMVAVIKQKLILTFKEIEE